MSRASKSRGGPPGSAPAADRLPPVVTIERDGQCIVIWHDCEPILKELAAYFHAGSVHPTRGFLTVPCRKPLYVVEPTGLVHTIVPAGYESVVIRLLEEAGHEVRVVDRPVRALAAPRGPAGGDGPPDPALLDFVRDRERGLIRLGPGVAPERLIAQDARAYPDITIAVAAVRRDDVEQFGRRLKALAPQACWSTRDDFPAEPGPLVVTTYQGLGDHGVAIHRRDVLFCLEAYEALGEANQVAILTAAQARLFGLARRGDRPAPYDRDRAWARFGFDVLDIPRHGRVARPVEVVTRRIAGDKPAARSGPAALKRGGIWGHPIRNRRVARLAAALAGGDPGAIAAELPAVKARAVPPGVGILVLVEGLEHAANLAPHLPGWGLSAGPDVDVPPPAGSSRVPQPGGGATAQPRIVATLDGLRGVDLEGVDVLIRADGGVGVPAALTTAPCSPVPDRGPLLLVDFDDRHHPELRRRARARREAYLRLGWAVDGRGGPASPLEHFRATRPRGAR